ncbi:MAG: glycosyltransferase, partial [Chloroflexota bacterium]|nr:glycosyltransferase [Chloroflexota bacterium]
LRDPGYNVAYWNLHDRRVESADGGYLAAGRPLRFFHFSGFDPNRPDVLSRHQNRIDLNSDPVLLELCRSYAEELHGAGLNEARRWRYDYAALPDGSRLDVRLRRLLRQADLEGGMPMSPFTERGMGAVYDFLNEPASPEGPPEMTRALSAVYRGREDLQRAFPDINRGDRAAFLAWIRANGRKELSLPDALIPTPARELPEAEARAKAQARLDPWGVNVAGYLRSELGVGEAARMAIAALDAAGVPVLPIHGAFTPRSRQGHDYAHVDTGSAAFPVNLVCVNADMLPGFAEAAGPGFFEGRYTIGMWFWEIGDFPERWHGSFAHLDELWVASEHIADTLTRVSPVPVFRTRLPVTLPEVPRLRREALGLPEGFLFLTMLDFDSVLERKNPLGAIRAFDHAFPTPGRASLVLKTINSEYHPERLDLVLGAAAERPDIHVVDRYVSPSEKNAMLASCDCFVSLHRAEGFGIVPAEAMWLGTPVIATAYGGTLDFMSPENSFLVEYTMVEIGPGNDPYPAHSLWADPDEEQAASLMRLVVEDEGERQQRAQRAAHDIRTTHSTPAAGAVMQQRLEQIRDLLVERPGGHELPTQYPWHAIEVMSGGDPWQALEERSAPPPSSGPLGRQRDLFRRGVLRVMQPFTAHQRDVNAATVDAIVALRGLIERGGAAAALGQAELMRQLRVQADRLESAASAARVRDDVIEQAERLLSETRALPYMDDPGFEVFDAGEPGRVYGYRDESGVVGREQSYRAFEDIFRGSEELIADRQRAYLEMVVDHAPVLDAGCGRGEFLDILGQAGVEAVGVDADAGMVEHCRSKGHLAEHSDVNAYLEQIDAGALGAIFCAQ